MRVTDVVTAVPGLEGLLAAAASALLRDEDDRLLPPPDPDLEGRAWLLRVDLLGMEPPVWREVLVDPNLPLDRLHDVVQRLFEWEDEHLHEWLAAGPGGRLVRLRPPDPEDEIGAMDEGTTRLAHLLSPGSGELLYRYDFGDEWTHEITVVGDRPRGETELPRCVAASGRAPAEDSGGPEGWSEMLAAAAEPGHPDHAETRLWLGLRDGTSVDPTVADTVAIGRRLAGLE